MEFASGMQGLSQFKDAIYAELRVGQKAVLRYIEENPNVTMLNVHHPTGYGKTLNAIVVMKALMLLRRIQRVLIVVPNTQQLEQYRDDLISTARRFNIALPSDVSVVRTRRALREHLDDKIAIFVTTIQQISAAQRSADNLFIDLTEKMQWLLVADEHHHYAENADWGNALKLPFAASLAMSATPARMRGNSIFGEPTPGLSVTYAEAVEEKAVKRFRLRTGKYFVDALIGMSDLPERLTTEDIRDEVKVSGGEAWEIRKEIRGYSAKYVTPIINAALLTLDLARGRTGLPVQMLVYVHSCRAAQKLAEQLKGMTDLRIDWAGTGPNGRSPEENSQVTQRFLGNKNPMTGRRDQPQLDVFVQVQIASEGFDSIYVGVICDLSLVGPTPQKIQAYGRGARVYPNAEWEHQECIVYVPTDSKVTHYDADLATLFDDYFGTQSGTSTPRRQVPEEEIEFPEELPAWKVSDVTVREIQEPDIETLARFATNLQSRNPSERREWDVRGNERDRAAAADAWKLVYTERMEAQNHEDQIEEAKRKLESIIGTTARLHVVRKKNGPISGSVIGDVKRILNGRVKRFFSKRDISTLEELKTAYDWVADMYIDMQHGRFPRFLP